MLKRIIDILSKVDIDFKIIEVWDNSSQKQGSRIVILGNEYTICSSHFVSEDVGIIITTENYEDQIKEDLIHNGICKREQIKNWRTIFNDTKNKIITKYRGSNDPYLQSIIEYLKENDLHIFNGGIYEKNMKEADSVQVEFDSALECYYTYWMGKKLYLKCGSTKEGAKGYVQGLRIEQDNESPHCYNQDGLLSRKNFDIVIDAGAAEGFLGLEYVDTAKEIFLIEPDPIWIEALKKTFAPWKEKVVIVPKFIGERTDSNTIKIDDIIAKHEKSSILLKMDVEGCELSGLKGIDLFRKMNITVLVCAYHKSNDARELSQYLLEHYFDVKFTHGYMFFYPDEGEIEAELRRGLIVARKKGKEGGN